jgi:hypothetical protein
MESLRGLALAREARGKMEAVDCCRRDPLVFMERKNSSVRRPVPEELMTVEMSVVRGVSVMEAIRTAGEDGWVEIRPGVWMIPKLRMVEIQKAFQVLQVKDKEKQRAAKAKYKANARKNAGKGASKNAGKDGDVRKGVSDRPECD